MRREGMNLRTETGRSEAAAQWSAFRSGDETAFADVMNRYGTLVRSEVRRCDLTPNADPGIMSVR